MVRLDEGGRDRHLDAASAAVNNRVLPLVELLGAVTDTAQSPLGEVYTIKLLTRDETLHFEVSRGDVKEWFARLQDAASFAHIPAPGSVADTDATAAQVQDVLFIDDESTKSALSAASNAPPGGASIVLPMPHRSGRSAAPTVPADVLAMLSQVQQKPYQGLVEVSLAATHLQSILRLLPLARCHRAAAGHCLERVVLATRALCNPLTGPLSSNHPAAGDGLRSLLLFRLAALLPLLADSCAYLTAQSGPGWLSAAAVAAASPADRYRALDAGLAETVAKLRATSGGAAPGTGTASVSGASTGTVEMTPALDYKDAADINSVLVSLGTCGSVCLFALSF
jgi:hypothetical protein